MTNDPTETKVFRAVQDYLNTDDADILETRLHRLINFANFTADGVTLDNLEAEDLDV